MPNVFATNKTSSSITVAGHKVYYIDSTDAEIVEVEGQGSGGSTASDDVTGTISGMTLPTTHSYTGATFDSLRYYAKGTVSDRAYEYGLYGNSSGWYGGTITWMDESLGDLSGLIFTTGTPSTSSSSAVTQTILRVYLITVNSISGYPVRDTMYPTGAGQISDYTYNNGVHSIRLWFANIGDWTYNSLAGRLMFRFLDDTTAFNNLSAFDLITASGGTLLKDTSTDRYDMYNVWGGDITLHAMYGSAEAIRRNAFKYTLSGTPYWYVIDGEHDTWTDDLSAWGYSEVPVGPVLPEVILSASYGTGSTVSVVANGTTDPLKRWSGSAFNGDKVEFDNTKVRAFYSYSTGTQTINAAGVFGVSWIQTGGTGPYYMCAKNVSGSTQNFYSAKFGECSDSSATVITVYDSSFNAYNAFKYTANGTDYYYVLDGTQTDWTDDLAGIGYHDYLEVTLYMPGGSSNLKYCQPNVTSGYTGQPDSNYLYGIFTDSSCTQTFNYDSTKRYERGWYSNGEWNVASLQSIADMPSTTVSSDGKKDFILVSSGGVAKAWYISNLTTSSYLYYPNNNPLSIIYRIYSL